MVSIASPRGSGRALAELGVGGTLTLCADGPLPAFLADTRALARDGVSRVTSQCKVFPPLCSEAYECVTVSVSQLLLATVTLGSHLHICIFGHSGAAVIVTASLRWLKMCSGASDPLCQVI